MPSMNVQAKESSKEEECYAICKLRGVEPSAPVGLQLKASSHFYWFFFYKLRVGSYSLIFLYNILKDC